MIKEKYRQYVTFAAKKPLLLLSLTLLLLVLSYPIRSIHFDNNGEGWYPKSSERLQLKNRFIKDFGSDEMMMYLLTFPNNTPPEKRAELLKNVSDSIKKKIYNIETVFSKSDISDIQRIVGEHYAQKMEKTYFQSNDSLCEMLFLKIRLNKDILKVRPLVIDSLQKVANNVLPNNVRKDLSGQSVIYSEINRLSSEDSVKLFAICFLLICGLLFWQVRKLKYIAICLFLLFLSIIPAISLFGWLDIPINMITITVPLLFIVNFSSFAIHVITKQSKDVQLYLNRKLPPIITSAVATIIGFGSLATSNIHIIAQYGILTSLGILIGLFTFLFIGVPLVIRLIEINHLVIKTNWLNQTLDRFYLNLTKTLSTLIVAIVIVIFVSSIVVCFTIKSDTNMINMMKQSNKQRQTIEYIEQHFGSANVVDFLITKKGKEELDNNDFRVMADVNRQIATLPFVKSIVGYDLWRPIISKAYVYDPTMADQLKSGFITKDQNRSRMSVMIPSASVKEMDKMLQAIQTKINSSTKNTNIEIKPVGFLPLFVEQLNTVVEGMLYGLLLAVILIQIVMSVLVGNLRLGFLTMMVTIFPLSGIALTMKLLNIPFDVGTAVISSVVIGMIADDAIHIVWNYKRRIKKLNHTNEGDDNLFANSIRKIVFPCTVTSIMFSFGFLVLVCSNMVTIIHFGVLCTVTIVLAWISDFILFPALIKLFYKPALKANA
jgi:predicted RND superfamily exporter protein